MSKVSFVFQCVLFVLLILVGNGNIHPFSKPVPPFAKFLDPFKGVWNHNVTQGNIEIPSTGLSADAKIYYDDHWVPHIFASKTEDALFLQGYVEAQNRLFQMDFISRAAAGELSAVMGSATLEYDLDKRRRGMKFAAENAVAAWEKMPQYHLAQRYIDGVNTYIESLKPKDYPLEYKLLHTRPEKWTALKSALIFKEMSLTLCGRNNDIPFSNTKNSLDSTLFATWYPEYEDIENPVIPDHIIFDFDSLFGKKQDPSAFITTPIEKVNYETRNPGIGSNQWTVGKNKTSSGANIFCNDPHLGLGLPSIWFEQHIVTPDFNAYGVSFPGFPGIMIGFNEYIAWGETNVGQDVEDLFLIDWTDASRTTYLLDGQSTKATLRIEKIDIKGQKEPLYDTIPYTVWGPIYKKSNNTKSDLALRWLAHDKPKTEEYMTFIDAMKCKSYEEYLKSTEPFTTPAQNFGCAAVTGDIGIRVNGVFPAKYDQDGRFVEYGNRSSNGWQAFIPKEQNPHVLNPPENFVASANQRSASRNYPYYFTGTFENYRNKTINQTLRQSEKITVEDMKKMQFDAYSAKAAEFISVLPESCAAIKGTSNIPWYTKLKSWDAQYRRKAQEPVFFELYLKHLRKSTYDELESLQEKIAVMMPKDWVLFKMITQQPNNPLFNIKKTSSIETAKDIQMLSFILAAKEMDSLLTVDPNIRWGTFRPLDINHLTRVPALSTQNLEADGCPDAINAKGNAFGPSWRMIVHQTKPLEAYGVYPGGQSGNPFSPYYKNMISDWLEGRYHTLTYDPSPKNISAKSISTLTFISKKS